MKTKYPLYLDYAATTPVASEVLEEMLPFFREDFGNASSRHHAFGWLAEDALETAKERISTKLSCKKKDIVFTSGATESINLALKGLPYKQLITFTTEHKATLEAAASLAHKVVFIEVDKHGLFDVEEVRKAAMQAPSLISSLWVNNETGVISPIAALAEIKQSTGALLHVDATQAVGKIPVDFENCGADALSFSGHKIFGPKGVGALLVNEEIKAQIHGGGQQRNRRSGTLNIPGIVGLGKAVERIELKPLHELQEYFEKKLLQTFPSAEINAAGSPRVPHIVNVKLNGHDSEEILMRLNQVAISNGSACNAASTTPSHVLKAMHQSDAEAYAGLRFSFCENTTKEELDFALYCLKEVVDANF